MFYRDQIFFHINHGRQLAQWLDARMPRRRPGFNSPLELTRLFHLSQILIVDISGRIHRYLYIKDICDVIIQYKGHNGNESVHYLLGKIIEEN